MARTTLPERLFHLHHPEAVDLFLDRFHWCAVFKAGSGDKTVHAWLAAQHVLEGRDDVAVGFIVLPGDRPASERVSARTAITHHSPQIILFERGHSRVHLDEFDITQDRLAAALSSHLPAQSGLRVVNEDVVSLSPYLELLTSFVSGTLRQERFEWAYLERLQREAGWRDDATFEVLNALFENPDGRDVRPARIIAREFKGQLAGELLPLSVRARRHLNRLTAAPRLDPSVDSL
jgi:hypothetical protein